MPKALMKKPRKAAKAISYRVKSASVAEKAAPMQAAAAKKAVVAQNGLSKRKPVTNARKAAIVTIGNTQTELRVEAMDLDELLETLQMVKLGMKGEKLPVAQSSAARKYAGQILELDKNVSTRSKAKKMLDSLVLRIVELNKETTDSNEGQRLYRSLMAED